MFKQNKGSEMNERLKELAEQAGLWFDSELSEFWIANNSELERFAELVRQDERELCAKLVEGGNYVHPKAPDAVWAKTVAKLIRARGNHEQD
jgi:hypothetical protein